MKLRTLALCASIALLTACGGGDGGSTPPTTGGGGGSGGGGGGGTPPPPPPPTITYTVFDDLMGDQTFDSSCAGNMQGGGSINPLFASPFGNGLTIDYAETPDSWTLMGSDFTITFGPADLAANQIPNSTTYSRANAFGTQDSLFVGNGTVGSTQFEYLRGLRLFFFASGSDIRDLYCVFGVPTQLDDDLPASTVNYTNLVVVGNVLVTAPPPSGGRFDLSDSVVTFSANPNTGEITTSVELIGRQIQSDGSLATDTTAFGTFSGTTSIDGTVASFDGVLNSTDTLDLGSTFGGWFFGPQGAEVGYSFEARTQLSDGTPVFVSGLVAGLAP